MLFSNRKLAAFVKTLEREFLVECCSVFGVRCFVECRHRLVVASLSTLSQLIYKCSSRKVIVCISQDPGQRVEGFAAFAKNSYFDQLFRVSSCVVFSVCLLPEAEERAGEIGAEV